MHVGYNPAYCKVKLSPNIVFDGKSKDKMPYGQGTLTITYSTSQNNSSYTKSTETYGSITGFFDGNAIKDAIVSQCGTIDKKLSGYFEYDFEYDKTTNVAKLQLTLKEGSINGIPVENIPPISYIQTNKGLPEFSFDSTFIYNPHYDPLTWSWTKEIEKRSVASTVYMFGTIKPEPYSNSNRDYLGLVPEGYILKNGYKILGSKLEFTITTPTGSKISYNYHENGQLPQVFIRTQDGCEIKCLEANVERLNDYYQTKKIVSKWDVSFPNKSKYSGTLENIAGVTPQELFDGYQSVKINEYVKLLEKIEESPSSDIKLLDGTMRQANGESVEYINGDSQTELELIINGAPTIIEVKEAGKLLSCIPECELEKVRNLAIVGYLDDSDLKVLSNLGKRLVRLDLSLAFTTLSKQTRERREADAAALGALFGIISEEVDNRYADFNISTSDYKVVKTFSNLVKQAASDVKNSNKNCIIPRGVFQDMPSLEVIILPVWCNKIESLAFWNCDRLKEVTLPEHIETINQGAFGRCKSLISLKFPSTITEIGAARSKGRFNEYQSASSFEDCTSLKYVDLSLCTWANHEWNGMFYGCDLSILKLPRNLQYFNGRFAKTIYANEGIKTFRIQSGTTVYFKDVVPPNYDGNESELKDCTLYVPKGSNTAYYAKFGQYCEIKEY